MHASISTFPGYSTLMSDDSRTRQARNVSEPGGIKSQISSVLQSPRLQPADFQDTYVIAVPTGLNASQFVRQMMLATPPWMHGLFHIHNIFSKPWGNKRQSYAYPKAFIQPGDKIGPFSVLSIRPNAVFCGSNDKHLRFRARYVWTDQRNGQGLITCTTQVQYKNRRGHLYFSLIKPFHQLLLPHLMRQVAQASQRQRGNSAP